MKKKPNKKIKGDEETVYYVTDNQDNTQKACTSKSEHIKKSKISFNKLGQWKLK